MEANIATVTCILFTSMSDPIAFCVLLGSDLLMNLYYCFQLSIVVIHTSQART